jgi:hypothetical protein
MWVLWSFNLFDRRRLVSNCLQEKMRLSDRKVRVSSKRRGAGTRQESKGGHSTPQGRQRLLPLPDSDPVLRNPMSLPRLAQNSMSIDTTQYTLHLVDVHPTCIDLTLAISLRFVSLGRHLSHHPLLLAWLLGRTFLHLVHARVPLVSSTAFYSASLRLRPEALP